MITSLITSHFIIYWLSVVQIFHLIPQILIFPNIKRSEQCFSKDTQPHTFTYTHTLSSPGAFTCQSPKFVPYKSKKKNECFSEDKQPHTFTYVHIHSHTPHDWKKSRRISNYRHYQPALPLASKRTTKTMTERLPGRVVIKKWTYPMTRQTHTKTYMNMHTQRWFFAVKTVHCHAMGEGGRSSSDGSICQSCKRTFLPYHS